SSWGLVSDAAVPLPALLGPRIRLPWRGVRSLEPIARRSLPRFECDIRTRHPAREVLLSPHTHPMVHEFHEGNYTSLPVRGGICGSLDDLGCDLCVIAYTHFCLYSFFL